MKQFLGIAAIAALVTPGCTDAEPEVGDTTGVAVKVASLDEASIAESLGEGWHEVEEGVFERDSGGKFPDRVAFGEAGRRAEIARGMFEVEDTIIAGYQSDAGACNGTYFEAQATVYNFNFFTAYAINSREGNGPWQPYTYVARYDNLWNPWFPIEGYSGQEYASLSTGGTESCDLVALARINMTQCGVFLHAEDWGSCSY